MHSFSGHSLLPFAGASPATVTTVTDRPVDGTDPPYRPIRIPAGSCPGAADVVNLGGLDSLLAMVQLPNGIPMATVAVNGARNAALPAVRILALSDPRIATALERFGQDLANQVRDQDAEIVARYSQS